MLGCEARDRANSTCLRAGCNSLSRCGRGRVDEADDGRRETRPARSSRASAAKTGVNGRVIPPRARAAGVDDHVLLEHARVTRMHAMASRCPPCPCPWILNRPVKVGSVGANAAARDSAGRDRSPQEERLERELFDRAAEKDSVDQAPMSELFVIEVGTRSFEAFRRFASSHCSPSVRGHLLEHRKSSIPLTVTASRCARRARSAECAALRACRRSTALEMRTCCRRPVSSARRRPSAPAWEKKKRGRAPLTRSKRSRGPGVIELVMNNMGSGASGRPQTAARSALDALRAVEHHTALVGCGERPVRILVEVSWPVVSRVEAVALVLELFSHCRVIEIPRLCSICHLMSDRCAADAAPYADGAATSMAPP